MKRMIFHRANSNFSIGVDISNDGLVRAAVSACHPNDGFKRSVANLKLNGRLNGKAEVIGTYSGEEPAKDIFGPIRDSVRHLTRRRNVDSVIPTMRRAINGPVETTSFMETLKFSSKEW